MIQTQVFHLRWNYNENEYTKRKIHVIKWRSSRTGRRSRYILKLINYIQRIETIFIHPSTSRSLFFRKKILQIIPSPLRLTHGSGGVDLCLAGDTPIFHWSMILEGRVSIEVASWRKLRFFSWWNLENEGVWCWKTENWTLKCWKSHRVWRRLNIESIWVARFLDGILLCRLCHLHIYLLGKLLQFTSLTSRGFHLNTNLLYLLGRVISCAIR